jgi:hypothetical protein
MELLMAAERRVLAPERTQEAQAKTKVARAVTAVRPLASFARSQLLGATPVMR